jgi:hypothetical protein
MAAVGGVAYMGAKAGTNKAIQGKQAAADAAAAPAAPATNPPPTAPGSDTGDRIAQLKQLADLHASGALTDEEFASEKAKVLG